MQEFIRRFAPWVAVITALSAGLVVVLTKPSAPTSIRSANSGEEVAAPPAASEGEQIASRTPYPNGAVIAVSVNSTIDAFARPSESAEVIASFESDPTFPATFLSTSTQGDLDVNWATMTANGEWLEVFLPVRPNGTTGWLRVDQVELQNNDYYVEIDRSTFELRVTYRGEIVEKVTVAIGTGATPTPIGRFFIVDVLDVPDPDGPYGPFAFVLSGFSEVIYDFNGGPGIVGIHGTNDPAALGTKVSHGCVRIRNDVIEELVGFLPVGTPVDIT